MEWVLIYLKRMVPCRSYYDQGSWILQGINYKGDLGKSTVSDVLELGKLEWNSDDDDDDGMHGPRHMSIVGFHPYKEDIGCCHRPPDLGHCCHRMGRRPGQRRRLGCEGCRYDTIRLGGVCSIPVNGPGRCGNGLGHCQCCSGHGRRHHFYDRCHMSTGSSHDKGGPTIVVAIVIVAGLRWAAPLDPASCRFYA
ncbi:hypothetical protein PR202_ga12954 [Eleusine coracana subsp. coracana]|uniref:Uncharacterized protein n=1 Tax=Eleusine coracana subsp. coracana TaxID=191504 RepID=A0AAV5CDM3_ELECO|nr:hypothetical protein PR202_ga12954 [Eleusine coracana subsp. coracana]